jgi:hypothetical protein
MWFSLSALAATPEGAFEGEVLGCEGSSSLGMYRKLFNFEREVEETYELLFAVMVKVVSGTVFGHGSQER